MTIKYISFSGFDRLLAFFNKHGHSFLLKLERYEQYEIDHTHGHYNIRNNNLTITDKINDYAKCPEIIIDIHD